MSDKMGAVENGTLAYIGDKKLHIYIGGEWRPFTEADHVDLFVKRHAELLEEVKQLRERRAEAVRINERLRIELQEIKQGRV